MNFLLCILCIFSVIILVYIVLACIYRSDSKNNVKISFNRFISLYNINPEKWSTHLDYCVIYNRDEYSYTIIYFTSYFDDLRYRHLKNREQRMSVNKEISETSIELLKS